MDQEMLSKIASTKAFYYDDLGHEVPEDKATNMMIVNYDADGHELFTVRSKCK